MNSKARQGWYVIPLTTIAGALSGCAISSTPGSVRSECVQDSTPERRWYPAQNAPELTRIGIRLGISRVIKLMVAPVTLIAVLSACGQQGMESVVIERALGDPERGRIAIYQYACHACHLIPGIVGSHARVGPMLKGIASQKYLAGVLPNTPDNMIFWIQNPQQASPLTAMPDMGVTESHARDIAAYLYTLQ